MVRSRSGTVFGRLAVLGVVLHSLLFALLHLLVPELSPAAAIISDYAQTSFGWLAVSAFLAFALIWSSLAVELRPLLRGPAMHLGWVLLALASLAIAVAAIFPGSADPGNPTVLSTAQNLVARPGLFLGIVLVSIGLRARPGWRGLGNLLLGLALASALLLVATLAVLLERGWGGLGQRVIFLLLYAWTLALAARLSARPPDTT